MKPFAEVFEDVAHVLGLTAQRQECEERLKSMPSLEALSDEVAGLDKLVKAQLPGVKRREAALRRTSAARVGEIGAEGTRESAHLSEKRACVRRRAEAALPGTSRKAARHLPCLSLLGGDQSVGGALHTACSGAV